MARTGRPRLLSKAQSLLEILLILSCAALALAVFFCAYEYVELYTGEVKPYKFDPSAVAPAPVRPSAPAAVPTPEPAAAPEAPPATPPPTAAPEAPPGASPAAPEAPKAETPQPAPAAAPATP